LGVIARFLEKRRDGACGLYHISARVDIRNTTRVQVETAAVEHESSDRWLFKDDAEPGTKHRLAGAEDVPSYAYAWRQIVVIGWIRRADALAYLDDARLRGWDIVGQQIARVLDWVGDVVAQAEVQSHVGADPEIVLGGKAEGLLADGARGIAVEETPAAHIPIHEISQVAEIDAASSITSTVIIHIAVVEGPAEADGMLAVGVGGSVGKTIRLAGGGFQGPAGIAAHVVKCVRPWVDAREPEQPRIGDTGIEAVSDWVDVVVKREDGFIEPVVAEAKFICPSGTERGSQAHAEYLGSRAGGRKPIRPQWHRIFFGLIGIRVDEAGAQY